MATSNHSPHPKFVPVAFSLSADVATESSETDVGSASPGPPTLKPGTSSVLSSDDGGE